MNIASPRVGDTVRVNHGQYPGLWTVSKINRVNVILTFAEGGRPPLRCPRTMLRDPNVVEYNSDPKPTEWYDAGQVVRVTSGKFTGLYVVIADKGDKVNIARLGGDGGRYVRMPKANGSMVKVDIADIIAAG